MSYTCELTAAGIALVAKAQTGTVINISRAEIGKGTLSGSISDLTSLIDPQSVTANIQNKEYVPGSNAKITVTYNNTGVISGFYVKEIGLFAIDPDEGEILFYYCYTDEADYLPVEGNLIEEVVNILIAVGNASNVTAQISTEGNVIKQDFSANSILKANIDNSPEMLLVGEDTFVGRKAGGNIESLTPNNTLEIIDKATNKSFIAAQSGIVLPWPTSNVPEGFLSCNGASVSRTTYADLFAVIGTEYGSVDIDSFSLPDYRGEFLRGWANGSNTDPDRDSRDKSGIIGDNVGSKQSSAMWGHKHNTFIDNSQTIGSPFTGLVGTGNGAGQDHPSFGPIEDNNGAPNISSESRPTNISVQFIIKT